MIIGGVVESNLLISFFPIFPNVDTIFILFLVTRSIIVVSKKYPQMYLRLSFEVLGKIFSKLNYLERHYRKFI